MNKKYNNLKSRTADFLKLPVISCHYIIRICIFILTLMLLFLSFFVFTGCFWCINAIVVLSCIWIFLALIFFIKEI